MPGPNQRANRPARHLQNESDIGRRACELEAAAQPLFVRTMDLVPELSMGNQMNAWCWDARWQQSSGQRHTPSRGRRRHHILASNRQSTPATVIPVGGGPPVSGSDAVRLRTGSLSGTGAAADRIQRVAPLATGLERGALRAVERGEAAVRRRLA